MTGDFEELVEATLAAILRNGASPDATPSSDYLAAKLAPSVAAAIKAASRNENDVMEHKALAVLRSGLRETR